MIQDPTMEEPLAKKRMRWMASTSYFLYSLIIEHAHNLLMDEFSFQDVTSTVCINYLSYVAIPNWICDYNCKVFKVT